MSTWAEGSTKGEDQEMMKRCGDEKRDLLPLSASLALYAPLTAVIDKHTLLLCIMTDYIC